MRGLVAIISILGFLVLHSSSEAQNSQQIIPVFSNRAVLNLDNLQNAGRRNNNGAPWICGTNLNARRGWIGAGNVPGKSPDQQKTFQKAAIQEDGAFQLFELGGADREREPNQRSDRAFGDMPFGMERNQRQAMDQNAQSSDQGEPQNKDTGARAEENQLEDNQQESSEEEEQDNTAQFNRELLPVILAATSLIVNDSTARLSNLLEDEHDPEARSLLQYMIEVNDTAANFLNGQAPDLRISIGSTPPLSVGLFEAGGPGGQSEIIISREEVEEMHRTIAITASLGDPELEAQERSWALRTLAEIVLHEIGHYHNYRTGRVNYSEFVPAAENRREAMVLAEQLAVKRANDEALAQTYSTALTGGNLDDDHANITSMYLHSGGDIGLDGIRPTAHDVFRQYFLEHDNPSDDDRIYYFDATEVDVISVTGNSKVRYKTHDNCSASPNDCVDSMLGLIGDVRESEFISGVRKDQRDDDIFAAFGRLKQQAQTGRKAAFSKVRGKREHLIKGDRIAKDQRKSTPKDMKAQKGASKLAMFKKSSTKKDARSKDSRQGIGAGSRQRDRDGAQGDQKGRSGNRSRKQNKKTKSSASGGAGERAHYRAEAHLDKSGSQGEREGSNDKKTPRASADEGGQQQAAASSGGASSSGGGNAPGAEDAAPAPRSDTQSDDGQTVSRWRSTNAQSDNADGSTTYSGFIEHPDGTMARMDITCSGASCQDQNGNPFQPQNPDGSPMTDADCGGGNCAPQDGTALVPLSSDDDSSDDTASSDDDDDTTDDDTTGRPVPGLITPRLRNTLCQDFGFCGPTNRGGWAGLGRDCRRGGCGGRGVVTYVKPAGSIDTDYFKDCRADGCPQDKKPRGELTEKQLRGLICRDDGCVGAGNQGFTPRGEDLGEGHHVPDTDPLAKVGSKGGKADKKTAAKKTQKKKQTRKDRESRGERDR